MNARFLRAWGLDKYVTPHYHLLINFLRAITPRYKHAVIYNTVRDNLLIFIPHEIKYSCGNSKLQLFVLVRRQFIILTMYNCRWKYCLWKSLVCQRITLNGKCERWPTATYVQNKKNMQLRELIQGKELGERSLCGLLFLRHLLAWLFDRFCENLCYYLVLTRQLL